MRSDLLEKEVLAMYDVRDIQGYIFKTNKVKEIIGGSIIVDNLILGGLKEYTKSKASDLYLTDWENDSPDAFIKEGSNILMQVMFVGGGNAYVLFRKGSIAKEVNRYLGKYVLDKTYSLNLAVAVIEKTNSYKNDYSAINLEMRRIKACMPSVAPVGAFPFMSADSITGYPISKYDGEYLCSESFLKIRASEKDKEGVKILDDLVPKKGDNSTLALVHMDGNSLGKRIMNVMSGVDGYLEAIKIMRNLSSGIYKAFNNAFNAMVNKMNEKTNRPWYRKIVLAGDDITFICNGKMALNAVECFLKALNKENADFIGKGEILTACAGIAYCNSHFPFSDAYKSAEACLDNAKDRAKESKHSINNLVGNFVDFQLCSNVNSKDLDDYREKHYMVDGESFIARPYYVDVDNDKGLNIKNKNCSLKLFKDLSNKLADIPRNVSKEIRGVIPLGDNEIEKEINFLNSRGYDFDDLNDDKGIYYDALELLDLRMGEDHEN